MESNINQIILEIKENSILRMSESLQRIDTCINRLSEEQIWHKPNENSNSIANLVLHLSGNIHQYIVSSLGESEDIRDRDLEFNSHETYSKKELLDILNNTCRLSTQTIKNVDEDALLRFRMVQGFELSGIGIITHVVEHFSYHVGQIALISKIHLNKDLGFYADLDLTIKNN